MLKEKFYLRWYKMNICPSFITKNPDVKLAPLIVPLPLHKTFSLALFVFFCQNLQLIIIIYVLLLYTLGLCSPKNLVMDWLILTGSDKVQGRLPPISVLIVPKVNFCSSIMQSWDERCQNEARIAIGRSLPRQCQGLWVHYYELRVVLFQGRFIGGY